MGVEDIFLFWVGVGVEGKLDRFALQLPEVGGGVEFLALDLEGMGVAF